MPNVSIKERHLQTERVVSQYFFSKTRGNCKFTRIYLSHSTTDEMIFRNNELRETLLNKGFSKIPRMDENSLAKLKELYSGTLASELKPGETYWSMSGRNKELAAEINKSVVEILLPYIQLYFGDVKPIVGTFMIKTAYAPDIHLHQDWTFVEHEPQENSYTCWIPLVDTHAGNGRLGFLPNSHNKYTAFRGSPSPPFGHLFPQDGSLEPQMEYIDQQPGEGVVFNHRIIHASEPNLTGVNRPAVGIIFTSVKNKLVHLFVKPGTDNSIAAKYEVDPAFYDKYSNIELLDIFMKGGKITDYKVIEEIPVTL